LTYRERGLRGAAERSISESRRAFDKRVDVIRAELKERGPEAVEKVERSLNELKEYLRNSFGEIQGRFEDKLETRRREVREIPPVAVGIAVTVGVIFGLFLGLKSKD
jgi:ElaB/YqjD/DUF883 family membrane-anchored ribosome-binding protein